MTDKTASVLDAVEAETNSSADINDPDFGFGFTPLEQFRAATTGPTRAMIEKVNHRLAQLSDDDQRNYGGRVVRNHLTDPRYNMLNADDFIADAEEAGINLPELVKTVIRETVDAEPRDTFEKALQKAKIASRHPFVEEFNDEQNTASADELYTAGFDGGKIFQKGWNTAQFTGEQIIELAAAEGGRLSEAARRGLRDAYAHYTPAQVAVSEAQAVTLVGEA